MTLAAIAEFGPHDSSFGIRFASSASGSSPHRSVRGAGISTPAGRFPDGTNGFGAAAVVCAGGGGVAVAVAGGGGVVGVCVDVSGAVTGGSIGLVAGLSSWMNAI